MQITRNQFCKIMLLLESVSRSDSLRAQWRDAPLPKHPRRTHRLGRERGGCCPQWCPPLFQPSLSTTRRICVEKVPVCSPFKGG